MRSTLVCASLSYRALFNWTTPAMFVGTLLVSPIFQLLFFVHLGRTLGVADDRYYLAGVAVLTVSLACVYGGTMAIANERRYGTLGCVLLSARGRTALFLGRALPYAANGLLVAVTTLGVGSLVLGLPLPLAALPGLAVALVLAAASCALFGLALGAVGLRLRDVWLVSNVSVALLTLLTGVNVPSAVLPAWMRLVGAGLPITHAAAAARSLVDGRDLVEALPSLLAEAAVAVGYAVMAAVLLRVFEVESRRSSSLETL